MKRLQTISEAISRSNKTKKSKPEEGADITIVEFMGNDDEGNEKGVKFAAKKGTVDKKMFNAMKKATGLRKVFPPTIDDIIESTWADEADSLEKDLATVEAELQKASYTQVLEDYV